MKRRKFLTGLAGSAALGGLPNSAWSAGLCRNLTMEKDFWTHGSGRCKIIGVGGAGCNFVMSDSLQDMLRNSELNPELICVNQAAQHNQAALKDMVSDFDLVYIVAGLGGETGSTYAPIMASLARQAGAITVVAAITPFDWEVQRSREAQRDLMQLRHAVDLVLEFSNAEQAIACGNDALMADIFKRVDQRIAQSIVKMIA